MPNNFDDPSIPGWFNFHQVYERMVESSPSGASFVEVGAWLGRSTAYLAKKIRASGKQISLHVVDTWKGSPHEPVQQAEVIRHGGDLFPAFRENMRRVGVFDIIKPIQQPSVQAARGFNNGSLDFVYLDAAHDPASVAADIRAWWPKIKTGGYLGGHEYGTRSSVTRVVDSLFGSITVIRDADSWLLEKTPERASQGPATKVMLMPTGSVIEPGCEDGLRELERRGYTVWRVRGYSAIDVARNQIATDALSLGFEELLWVDSDVVFQADDVERLRSHNLPLVFGPCAKKSRREFATIFLPGTASVRFGRWGGLTEVRYCGFGFVYTRREVYDTIQANLKLPVCNERFGSSMVPYFAPMVIKDGEGSWYLGEDYAFCERARQCGFKIIIDTAIRLWHVGNYRYGWEDAGSEKERYRDYTFHLPSSPNTTSKIPEPPTE